MLSHGTQIVKMKKQEFPSRRGRFCFLGDSQNGFGFMTSQCSYIVHRVNTIKFLPQMKSAHQSEFHRKTFLGAAADLLMMMTIRRNCQHPHADVMSTDDLHVMMPMFTMEC